MSRDPTSGSPSVADKKGAVRVHLIDGTYELFRAFYGPPPARAPAGPFEGREVGATRGLLRTLVTLLRDEEVTHIGCAFDHQVESFRNRLLDGYKTAEGIDPDLYAQFPLAEQAARALGITTWPMVDYEADDGIATAAARCHDDARIEQVRICSPDKDLMQCVRDARVVVVDRRRRIEYDEPSVQDKLGVPPLSVPDFLALVGDAADGIPGLEGWGAKTTSKLLLRYHTLDAIPDDPSRWDLTVRRARSLAATLRTHRREAELYRELARLRTDAPIATSLETLRWQGPNEDTLQRFCEAIGEDRVVARVPASPAHS